VVGQLVHLRHVGAAALARMLADGELTAPEVLEIYLERIARLDTQLRCFRVVLADSARYEAAVAQDRLDAGERLPLLGVPIAPSSWIMLIGVTGFLTEGLRIALVGRPTHLFEKWSVVGWPLSALFDLPSGAIIVCALAGVGAVYKQGLKGPGGRRIEGDYEIVECQPNALITFHVISGPARPTGKYRFERVGNSTRLTFTLHYEPKGLTRLMGPMITQTMRSEVATLANLKAYLEGQHS